LYDLAVNSIIKALTDPDPEVRESAHEELAVEMNDDLAEAIVDIATGQWSDDIRAEAIIALGPLIEECGDDYDHALGFEWAPEYGPPVSRETFGTVVEQIRAIYDDESAPKLLRRRAFEVLVRDPQPWQRDEIRKHYASNDEEWRLTAIFGMGSMTGFEEDLLVALENSQGLQLFEAVRAVGQMAIKRAASTIRHLASSTNTDRDLRFAAILALPNVDNDAYEFLEKLSRSKDRELAEVAREALDEVLINASVDDEDFDDEEDFDEE